MPDPEASARSSFSDDHHPLPAAQAQAALLIVESLLHALLDLKLLTKEQVLAVLDAAADVKEDSAAEEKEPARTRRRSLALLQQMRNSMDGRTTPGR